MIDPRNRLSRCEWSRVASEAAPCVRTLFVSSGGESDYQAIQYGPEIREISAAIRQGRRRASFALPLIYLPAQASGDIVEFVSRHEPHIIHVSAHGIDTDGGAAAIELPGGRLGVDFFVGLLQQAPSVIVVVFNACHTSGLAKHVSRASGVATVGASGRIDDDSANVFAKCLYQGLADGLSLTDSFARASLVMATEGQARYELYSWPEEGERLRVIVEAARKPRKSDEKWRSIHTSVVVILSFIAPIVIGILSWGMRESAYYVIAAFLFAPIVTICVILKNHIALAGGIFAGMRTLDRASAMTIAATTTAAAVGAGLQPSVADLVRGTLDLSSQEGAGIAPGLAPGGGHGGLVVADEDGPGDDGGAEDVTDADISAEAEADASANDDRQDSAGSDGGLGRLPVVGAAAIGGGTGEADGDGDRGAEAPSNSEEASDERSGRPSHRTKPAAVASKVPEEEILGQKPDAPQISIHDSLPGPLEGGQPISCDVKSCPPSTIFVSLESGPFCIDAVEVSVSNYEKCISAKKCSYNHEGRTERCNLLAGWGDAALNCITKSEAGEYCVFKGKRAPSAAQWRAAKKVVGGLPSYPWAAGVSSESARVRCIVSACR